MCEITQNSLAYNKQGRKFIFPDSQRRHDKDRPEDDCMFEKLDPVTKIKYKRQEKQPSYRANHISP